MLASETILSLQTNATCTVTGGDDAAVEVGSIPTDTLCHVGASSAKH